MKKSLRVLLPDSRLFLFLALVIGCAVLATGQPVFAGEQTRHILTNEQRHRLEKALEDSTLTRWQRRIATNLLNPGSVDVSASPYSDGRSQGSASTDGDWSQILLPGMSGHTAIHDPLRDRMVVFGGYDYSGLRSDVWALSLSGSPPWTKLNPIGTSPPDRVGGSAIYDPVRDRIVTFGGYDWNGSFNDVWALSLSGTPAWTQLTPTGTTPNAVGGPAIYDPVRDRMVICGGGDWSLGLLNNVWALSLSGTPAWTQLNPTGALPKARSGHTAIYDPLRDRIVIFGGEDDGYPFAFDTWALSLSPSPAWTQLTPTGTPPPGRANHTAIYDPGRDRMVVFGGTHEGGRSRLNDTWAISFSWSPEWTQLTPTGTPQARLAHTAIYDSARRHMVVFGGDDDVYYPDLNDVWSLDLLGSPEWTPGPGTAPSPRNEHTAIYDRARDRMVIFSGYGAVNDVWGLSMSDPAWSELLPTGTPPSARFRHTAIYDPVRSRMVVFGGYDWFDLRNDVWALSLSESPAWTALSPAGTPPMGRVEHTAIYDPVRDRMVVCGGYDWPTFVNDVWALSLSGTPTWTEITPAGTSPPARYGGHTAIYDPVRDRMVIFGGTDATYPYPERNDVWALSLSGTPEWTELTPTGTPAAARERHTAIYDPMRDRMVVFQGHSHAVGYDGDPWALSLSGTPEWTHLTPAGVRGGGRDAHTAIYDPVRDRMVIFAGTVDMHSDWEDVWTLEWGAATAVQPSPTHFADALQPCYPNPFNPRVTIPFQVKEDGKVTLAIFDVAGRLVKTVLSEWTRRGAHTVRWDGKSNTGAEVSSGVYFCRFSTEAFVQTRKIVLIK